VGTDARLGLHLSGPLPNRIAVIGRVGDHVADRSRSKPLRTRRPSTSSLASIQSFNLFAQPQAAFTDAWNAIVPLLQSGAIKPIVAKTFPLTEAAVALRYLVEGRPFGRVVLTT
jgi:NADPH:quinone reductase-like Zn-dependent oxidoreductase